MKKIFCLLVAFCIFNVNALPDQKTNQMAFIGMGLLSTSMFCTIEAACKHFESWQTSDPDKQCALIMCRNSFLKGTVLAGLPAIAFLSKASGNKITPGRVTCANVAAIMFGMSASFYKHALKYHEEFENTGDIAAKQFRDQVKAISAFAGVMGLLFSIPVISEV